MCFDDKVNYYDLGELLDFVSNDIYPAGHWQQQPHQPENELAASHDVVRSYKKMPFLDDGAAVGYGGLGNYGTGIRAGADVGVGNAVCCAWS